MKRIEYTIWLLSLFTLLTFNSCESFLDKSPDMGLAEEDIYKDYNSITGFLDYAYSDCLINYFNVEDGGDMNNNKFYLGGISDEFSTTCNESPTIDIHAGNWLKKNNNSTDEIGNEGKSQIGRSYRAIRIKNRVLANIDKINLTETERNKVLGQAYFYRAWYYFQLIIRLGGMPKLDKVFTGDGDENIPRMTYHESHAWMMEDIEKALQLLPEYWDENNVGRPDRMATLGFRAMAQLYDASPLMQNGLTHTVVMPYDQERAALAAQYSEAAVRYMNSEQPAAAPHKRRLMTADEYTNIFYFKRGNGDPFATAEAVWYCRKAVDGNRNTCIRRLWLPLFLETLSGIDAAACYLPTQNMVNLYEKKGADGKYYPITDSRSGYNLQDPYTDRDPRFYNNIRVPGQQCGDNKGTPLYMTMFKDGEGYNGIITNPNSNKRGQTGYICNKFIWPEAQMLSGLGSPFKQYFFNTTYIRASQLYLDYAEASFEATGSATARVAGCSLSAEEALNTIRNRIGLTNVASDIVADPAKFRETLRRERTVELMFECHRWNDIRRWMIAHELFNDPHPIKGMLATPNNVGTADVPTFPTSSTDPNIAKLTYTYEEYDVVPEVRVFEMKHYWYPFTISDVASVSSLVQNPGW
ncbi:MAG: RagB/SusD family nutrient uptake outer membrane protein [Prevotella sp.]|nr:RagB/SusD family nutrient uptake outer membrane protein [Prevotella sp.]